jgi:ADP-ribosylglycohydrolase
MPTAVTVLDKFKGALVGCAVGDALGAPVEGMPPAVIRDRHGEVTGFLDERFGAGRITDDTQMTVALAQSILELGNFDIEQAALKFGRWIATSDEGVKEARGVGEACATACRRLHQGAAPGESGVDSAGCGAAMRSTPIGLRYYHDPRAMLLSSVDQAGLTHTDPRAAAGAAVIAFAVGAGITDEGELDRASFVARAADFVSGVDRRMSLKVAGLSDYLDASPAEGFAYTGNGGFVMEAVPAALFAFLHNPYDLEETVLAAVNGGGDADSIGAMAGAVSGAFNGVESIPARWKECVEGGEYLESLAVRLYTLTPAAKPKRRPIM